MAGLTERFVGLVRAALGLTDDPVPDIVRLGLYPAKVQTCASDGSKCDVAPVAPFDKLISSEKNVEVLEGIPGASAVVVAGAVVLLGWKGGDPSQPYCMPAWVLGASVTELVFKATLLHLGDKSGSNFVALANLVDTELTKISTTLASLTGGGGSPATFGTAYTRAGTAATKVKAV